MAGELEESPELKAVTVVAAFIDGGRSICELLRLYQLAEAKFIFSVSDSKIRAKLRLRNQMSKDTVLISHNTHDTTHAAQQSSQQQSANAHSPVTDSTLIISSDTHSQLGAVANGSIAQVKRESTSEPITEANSGMAEALYFEEIKVGDCWTSPSRTITETDVVNFAAMTGDFNPLHVDREFAEQTPYGQRVAHGILGLSWVAGLASGHPSVKTSAFVGIRNWEFLRPLFFGDTVHVDTTVKEVSDAGRRNGRVQWSLKLINQRDEVTQQGTFETLVFRKTIVPRPKMVKDRANQTETSNVQANTDHSDS